MYGSSLRVNASLHTPGVVHAVSVVPDVLAQQHALVVNHLCLVLAELYFPGRRAQGLTPGLTWVELVHSVRHAHVIDVRHLC